MPSEHSVLFHGSVVQVITPDPSVGADRKDFGRGFYTTPDRGQAEKFARLKARRAGTHQGWVSVYDYRGAAGLQTRTFSSANPDWFNFVLGHRGYDSLVGAGDMDTYDIVVGPVADDAVGLVLNQFVVGTYGDPHTGEARSTAIRLLLTQRLRTQVFFGTAKAVARLSFREAYGVPVD